MTRQFKELRLRLINSYQFHDSNTGFSEWKPGTPRFIKQLESQMLQESSQ